MSGIIKNSTTGLIMKIKNKLQKIKEDEQGLSGVVVAVLLILIAVLAIVLIWGFLGGWLEELWEQIVSNTIE